MLLRTSFCLSLGAALLLARPAQAQKYITAAGLRIGSGEGGGYGLTVQQAVGRRFTIEGIGLVQARERSATLLFQHHFGILGPSLNYYFGAGAHLGHNLDFGPTRGLDGIVGVEYKIALIPIVLSLDFKPTYEFTGPDYARFPTAFSIRYVLIKRRQQLLRRAWPFRK